MNLCDKCELNKLCFKDKLYNFNCSNYEPVGDPNYKLDPKTILFMNINIYWAFQMNRGKLETIKELDIIIKRNCDKEIKHFNTDITPCPVTFEINETSDILSCIFYKDNHKCEKDFFDIDKNDEEFIKFYEYINYETTHFEIKNNFNALFIYPNIISTAPTISAKVRMDHIKKPKECINNKVGGNNNNALQFLYI